MQPIIHQLCDGVQTQVTLSIQISLMQQKTRSLEDSKSPGINREEAMLCEPLYQLYVGVHDRRRAPHLHTHVIPANLCFQLCEAKEQDDIVLQAVIDTPIERS